MKLAEFISKFFYMVCNGASVDCIIYEVVPKVFLMVMMNGSMI